MTRFFLIVDGIVDGSIRKSSLANLIKIRILKGGELTVGVFGGSISFFSNLFFLQLF